MFSKVIWKAKHELVKDLSSNSLETEDLPFTMSVVVHEVK